MLLRRYLHDEHQPTICCLATRKCLHLWDAPQDVLAWLNDPTNREKAIAATRSARVEAKAVHSDWSTQMLEKTAIARWVKWSAIRAAADAAADAIADASTVRESPFRSAGRAAKALGTTVAELRHEFVSTLTDEELANTDPDWIDYINAEIFSR